ncbi:MAG: helix-turn-helix transcriptional regulator [Pseudomonadota bacterium]
MKLSARESQILDLLQTGLTNKEIGQDLGISPHTVRDYISGLLLRNGLKSRTALAAVHVGKGNDHQSGPALERRANADRREPFASLALQM